MSADNHKVRFAEGGRAVIAPHTADLGDGDRLILPGSGIVVAEIEDGDGVTRCGVIVTSYQGRAALCATLTPDELREVAARMTEGADRMDAVAAEQADRALRKAAGK